MLGVPTLNKTLPNGAKDPLDPFKGSGRVAQLAVTKRSQQKGRKLDEGSPGHKPEDNKLVGLGAICPQSCGGVRFECSPVFFVKQKKERTKNTSIYLFIYLFIHLLIN